MKRLLLLLLLSVVGAGCTRDGDGLPREQSVVIYATTPLSRANDPDDQIISDFNLLIFNSFGILEEKVYMPERSLPSAGREVSHTTVLLREGHYTVLAAANLGYELDYHSVEDARSARFYLAYPDEYSHGIPMAALLEDVSPGDGLRWELPLERLMARIRIRVDRSALDADVSLSVTELRVGNCPSSALLFSRSKVESQDQLFAVGFTKSGSAVAALNRDERFGLSAPVDVYLLENCQGDLLPADTPERDKVLTDSRFSQVCSYVELRAEYHSASRHTAPDSRLVYRFYPGNGGGNFDVERNAFYSVTLRPEGDGLGENGWRSDPSGVK